MGALLEARKNANDSKPRLVLVLNLIGCESDPSFPDQSHNEVMQNQGNFGLPSTSNRKFLYANTSFSFFFFSLRTHMLQKDYQIYLSEILFRSIQLDESCNKLVFVNSGEELF